MAKIYSPNKQYNGISASVAFAKGVGEANDPILLDWFKGHGYTVEEEVEEQQEESEIPPIPGLVSPTDPLKHLGIEISAEQLEAYAEEHKIERSVEQLKAYAAEHGIDIGQSSSVNGILKKITDAEKQSEQGE